MVPNVWGRQPLSGLVTCQSDLAGWANAEGGLSLKNMELVPDIGIGD